jgi:hypothetical protein
MESVGGYDESGVSVSEDGRNLLLCSKGKYYYDEETNSITSETSSDSEERDSSSNLLRLGMLEHGEMKDLIKELYRTAKSDQRRKIHDLLQM